MEIASLTWTEWMGIAGCLTGLAALSIQYIQYMHAKPRIRIEITPECLIDMKEFHYNEKDKPDTTCIRPATYVVLTNVGQMSGVVMDMVITAKRPWWYHTILSKAFPKLRHSFKEYSNHKPFLNETSSVPFVLNSGHAWIGISDTKSFRNTLDKFTNVYLIIKTSYKSRPIRRRIKLRKIQSDPQ